MLLFFDILWSFSVLYRSFIFSRSSRAQLYIQEYPFFINDLSIFRFVLVPPLVPHCCKKESLRDSLQVAPQLEN